jgi:excisionase family DNA binding protein
VADTDIAAALLSALREIIREEVRAAIAEQPSPKAPEEVLTVRQAAEEAHVRPETIRDWVRSGRLKAIRVGQERRRGKTKSAAIRVLRSELDAALKPRADVGAAGLDAYERGRLAAIQLLSRKG